MPELKLSKKAFRKMKKVKNDWLSDFRKKNKAKLGGSGLFDNRKGNAAADDKIAKILEIEKMAPKERYDALVKLENKNIISEQKSLIAKLKLTLNSVVSVVTTVLVILLIYVIVNIIYKKYIEKNEEYSSNNFVDLVRLSINDIVPNLRALWKNIKNLFKKEEKKDVILKKKEVFNISKNDYTYNQAKKVCKALGCELATRDQVRGAWNRGAEWCNYGWTAGQYALFPTQQKTYDMLVKAGREKECGKPGLNGGYFSDPNMKFGVNCYGVKPKTDENNIEKLGCNNPSVIETIDKETGKYSMTYTCPVNPIDGNGNGPNGGNGDEIDISAIEVLPFNNYQWSIESKSSNLYIGENSITRNINDPLNKEEKEEESVPGMGKEDLRNSLNEIKNLLESEKFLTGLKTTHSKLLNSDSNVGVWKKVAADVIAQIKQVFLDNNIDTTKPKSSNLIKEAIVKYDDPELNSLKINIDTYLTKEGIQNIVNKLRD